MNNTIKKSIGLILISAAMAIFLFNADSASQGAVYGLKLCAEKVIPSLFMFMVISSYMIKSEVLTVMGEGSRKLFGFLFDLPKESGAVFIMSLMGGFPVGAKMIRQEVERGNFTKNQGKRMLLFCVNPGLAFVINMIGASTLRNKKAGVILFVGLVMSSFIIGIASRFFKKDDTHTAKKETYNGSSPFVDSINESIRAMIKICGWIILFSALMQIIAKSNLPGEVKLWLMISGEVTLGSELSCRSFPLYFTGFVLGWGGFSVHAQIIDDINFVGLNYKYFAVAKIVGGVLSMGISALLFRLFPCEVNVFSNVTRIIPEGVSVSVPGAIALVFLAALAILDLAPKEKV